VHATALNLASCIASSSRICRFPSGFAKLPKLVGVAQRQVFDEIGYRLRADVHRTATLNRERAAIEQRFAMLLLSPNYVTSSCFLLTTPSRPRNALGITARTQGESGT
jgi:hypothetical protein